MTNTQRFAEMMWSIDMYFRQGNITANYNVGLMLTSNDVGSMIFTEYIVVLTGEVVGHENETIAFIQQIPKNLNITLDGGKMFSVLNNASVQILSQGETIDIDMTILLFTYLRVKLHNTRSMTWYIFLLLR
jgi:hypothetical protein